MVARREGGICSFHLAVTVNEVVRGLRVIERETRCITCARATCSRPLMHSLLQMPASRAMSMVAQWIYQGLWESMNDVAAGKIVCGDEGM
jgi:hypothetical protein